MRDTRACLFDAKSNSVVTRMCRMHAMQSMKSGTVCARAAGTITGDIRVGGFPKVQHTFARVMGYVEQSDIHSPMVRSRLTCTKLVVGCRDRRVRCQHHQRVQCNDTVTLSTSGTRLICTCCGAADGAGVAGVLCAPAAPGEHAGPDGVRVCGRGETLLKTGNTLKP